MHAPTPKVSVKPEVVEDDLICNPPPSTAVSLNADSSTPGLEISRTLESYRIVRQRTMDIVAPLEIEDYVVQTASYMSPPRWHLGHTTWFFEMLLKQYVEGYRAHCEDYLYYFNSYYEKFGSRINKDRRGTKSRPTVRETVNYRILIDEQMRALFGGLESNPAWAEITRLIRLGIEHEMQHQELLVYDIKHLLADLYVPLHGSPLPQGAPVDGMAEFKGGLFPMGHLPAAHDAANIVPPALARVSSAHDFAYDNEKPAHLVYLEDYALDRAPVTCGQYLDFIVDGGYQDHRWWLSEGWNTVATEQWRAPLYWEGGGADWCIRDLTGVHPVKEKANEPVSHVSYFEAAAFAKWAGKRLPTEAEWENAARTEAASGRVLDFPWGPGQPDATNANLFENNLWSVAEVGSFPKGRSSEGCHQMIGDVWEWTSSDYAPYPGFKSDFDEYNDKFFINQKVLRGGSFATPRSHLRSTYRNFFGPHERWEIAGIRLAKSL
ncbi:MAG TPA: ergothioneine biosynthesis protein EgtB [Blastocatellia bacterium]